MPKLKAADTTVRVLRTANIFFFISFLYHLSSAQTINIYASPNGDTTGNGLASTSRVSIIKAKTIARANSQKTCIIWLASGTYPQLSLDASDSRPASASLTYQSINSYGAVFQPEALLKTSNFTPIPDSIKARIIDPTAKTKVMQMNLAPLNLPDAAPWASLFSFNNLRSPRFYRDGEPLPMSRYPSDTTMAMRQVITKGSQNSIPGGSFKYRDGRGKYWQSAINDGGLYLSGNWQYTWQMDVIKTLSLNTADSLIVQTTGISGGLGTLVPTRIPSGTEPYFALNLVEEINAEGQWSINFRTKMLYMWIPATGTISYAGNAGMPAILVTGVNNTKFVGITIRGGTGNGIELHDCGNMLVAGSRISDCSRNAITITDGADCVVQSNDIDSVGAGGVVISSSNFNADQFTLKSSGHQVINNHIYSYAREVPFYSGAVDVRYAIGTYVAYNKIHDSPHSGVLYGGNNNDLEYNEVYDVVKKYTDMGAFYRNVGGQAWTSRGNIVARNLIHDAPLANGIYEDAFSSGDSSSYNIMANSVLATFNNYGYFNASANNIYIHDTYPATYTTESPSDANFPANYASLQVLWNASAVYKKAYPQCVDMVGPAGRNITYASRIWPSSIGNVFIANPGVLSKVNDHLLFEADGTTNAAYAQTGPAFTSWGVLFKDDIKLAGELTNTTAPFSMDSLRRSGAFGKTGSTDWHINRIGLHTDAYRNDVSSTKTTGVEPILSLTCTSTNNYTNPQNLNLTATLKIPNAGKTLLSIWFTDKGAVMHVPITKKINTFDSVVYTMQWSDPGWGDHQIAFFALDTLTWKYSSNIVSLTVKSSATPQLQIAANPASSAGAALQWSNPNEINVGSYQLFRSSDGLNFSYYATINAKCNDSNSCSYVYPAEQLSKKLSYYQLKIIAADGSPRMSNIVHNQADGNGAKLSLFPNPARDLMNIVYFSPNSLTMANLVVYDIQGKILLKKQVPILEGDNTMPLALDNMADGIYLLEIQDQNGTKVSSRFVVRH